MLFIVKTIIIPNMRFKGAIVIDTERCKGCGICVAACPQKILALSPKKVNQFGYYYSESVDPESCIGCAACGIVCPDGCITVYKKKVEE